MRWRRRAAHAVLLAWLCLAPFAGAAAQAALGPSFPCPQPHDPLAALICQSPALGRDDLLFKQAFLALWQQEGGTGDALLRREAFGFDSSVRILCQLGRRDDSAPVPIPPPRAASCVERTYLARRDVWLARLSGPAREEATRPLEQHLALQRILRDQGYLPSDAPIDGVYGKGTREAISAWQRAAGRPVTGLLGDADAALLLHPASFAAPPRFTAPAFTPLAPGPSAAASDTDAFWLLAACAAVIILLLRALTAAARRLRRRIAKPPKPPPSRPAPPARRPPPPSPPTPAKPIEVLRPQSNPDIWACPNCGTNNTIAHAVCEVCHEPHPA